MWKSKRSHFNIYMNMLLPYLMLIVIFSLMGGYLYKQSIRIAEQQIAQKNEFLLREVQESMVLLNENTDRLFAHLSYIASTFKISEKPSEGKQKLAHKLFNSQVSRNFAPAGLFHDYILDYYIIVEEPAVILNNSHSLSFESYLLYNLELKGEQMHEVYDFFLERKYTQNSFSWIVSLIDEQEETTLADTKLAMLRSFGSQYSGQKGVIVLYFDRAPMLRTLSKIETGREGAVFILDEHGNIEFGLSEGLEFEDVSSLSDSEIELIKSDSHWMVTDLESSALHPFRYISIQSAEYLLDQTKRIRVTLLSVLFFLIVVGISFSLIIVYMNSRPIVEMYLRLQDKSIFTGENSFRFVLLRGLFSAFNSNVQELSDHLDEQSGLLRRTVIEKLLLGYHIDAALLQEVLPRLLAPHTLRYAVSIIEIGALPLRDAGDGIADIAVWKSQVKALIGQSGNSEYYIHDQSLNKMVLITQELNEGEYSEAVPGETLIAGIFGNSPFEIRIAMGGAVSDAREIHYSYEQAVLVMNEEERFADTGIAVFTPREKSEMQIYLPLDYERRLINSVIAGDGDTVGQILRDLYQRNFMENRISFALARMLLSSLTGILVNIIQRIGLDDQTLSKTMDGLIHQDVTINTYQSYFEELQRLFLELTGLRSSTQSDRRTMLMGELCRFIQENFSNPLLSADLVGERFNISANYVYKLFKDNYDRSFHQHLEHIRMNHSKMLLLHESEMTVKEVAREAGYGSLNTFYKAFKKNFGVSAGEFRRIGS